MSDRKKIQAVIADDSEYFCLALKIEFEKLGFEVITASDGPSLRKAIHDLPEASKALIIADVQMPIENGDVVLNDLEDHIKSNDFKVFLLSSDLPERDSNFQFLSKKLPPKEIAQVATKESKPK